MRLPPLRKRGDDIRLLANHFLRRFAPALDMAITGIAPEAIELMMGYRWPGNVRELQSVLRHALLEATGPLIVISSLPDFLHAETSISTAGPDAALRTQSSDLRGLRARPCRTDLTKSTTN